MEKYKSYKDLEIEFVDKIPMNWSVSRLKDLGFLQNGISKGKEYFGSGFPFVSYGNVYNDSIELEKINSLANSTKEEQKLYSVLEGDIFFTRTSETIDEIGISSTSMRTILKATFSGFVIRLRPKKNIIYKGFAKYFFKGNLNRQFLAKEISIVTRASLSQGTLNNLPVLLPSIKEQTQIANYLDAKTTAIDKKVTLLQQKIKHYKTYRKMVINEIVTKGLENDFSKWVSCRLKDIGYLYSGLSGKSGNDFNQDDNPNNRGFIPFTNIANNTYLDQNHLGTVVIEEKEKQNQVRKNDIFFLMSSEGYEDIGKSAVLIEDIEETYLNSFCKGFRITNKNCEASFINYLLFSDSYRQKMLVEGKGFTRINLKMEKVNNFSILIPPTKKEQQQIADYLDTKTTTIDKIINNIEAQITMLKELRKILINEVVTGKVKVTSTSLSHQKASNQPIV
ncbi:Type I restriction enzyme S subunit [Tenacibaculum maritimum]|uniref:restriction endonuclease subunit S n=1 Tax=Tenacibaculum maritimum TaxID=107401 RepID=UPI0012E43CAF|nr:restriction endonuclease subunit S [Tenacibaculum maritimum]CAA0207498.1 Type I restriction enzyme S subunit [Tenacibaculum maritimum]